PYTVSGAFPGGGDALEQLTLMSFVAAKSTRLRLITSVMILPHRNPVLTAKMLATIDVLSRGRVTVGVGVGWLREEFAALGAADTAGIRSAPTPRRCWRRRSSRRCSTSCAGSPRPRAAIRAR